jgi:hypothetical protein
VGVGDHLTEENRQKRVGEKRKSNQGYDMEIVRYGNAGDIDILIDGKHLLTNRSYDRFSKGAIRNPYHVGKRPSKKKADARPAPLNDRTGEKRLNNQGFEMEIIAYHSSKSIDVKVDGNLVTGKTYKHFKEGTIANPKVKVKTGRAAMQERVGEKGLNKEGFPMEIVAYRNCDDIDVEVDGHLVTGVRYRRFLDGTIENPAAPRQKSGVIDRVGEKNISNQGYSLEIVAYWNNERVDVLVDGKFLVTDRQYASFKRGSVTHPDLPRSTKKDRVGEKGISNQGYEMEIVAYRNTNSIDVKVDGKLVKNKTYHSFKRGAIGNPDADIMEIKRKNISYRKQVGSGAHPELRDDRIGEKNVSNEGYEMEIVAYRNTADIDVEIDGHIICNRTYRNFRIGQIRNPYHRGVCGIGYMGEGKYSWANYKKQHERWCSMMKRCYTDRDVAYKDCTVCEDWHCFQNYCEWDLTNYYEVEGERMEIDKDTLVKGNKVYGPDTCIFTPAPINFHVSKLSHKNKKGLPIGVSKAKAGTFEAKIRKDGKVVVLGTFPAPEEAFAAYKLEKETQIREVAESYKGRIPRKLYDALMAWEIEIAD